MPFLWFSSSICTIQHIFRLIEESEVLVPKGKPTQTEPCLHFFTSVVRRNRLRTIFLTRGRKMVTSTGILVCWYEIKQGWFSKNLWKIAGSNCVQVKGRVVESHPALGTSPGFAWRILNKIQTIFFLHQTFQTHSVFLSLKLYCHINIVYIVEFYLLTMHYLVLQSHNNKSFVE